MQCALTATHKPTDVCLTFDDNLLCQYEVAEPILRQHGLTAFWFVYTSVCQGKLERLEIYRHFRSTQYTSVTDFYAAFFQAIDQSAHGEVVRRRLAEFEPGKYLSPFPFYTDVDRKFRFVRDEVLGPVAYNQVMDQLMADAGTDPQEMARGLWMTDNHLQSLHRQGHVIGLHSHTHPTRMERLAIDAQRDEYRRNFDHLRSVLGESPEAMSHPCNSYNRNTVTVLRELGIRLGFRANMQTPGGSELEYPREDHANLITAMAA
jgi:peptidoglycan/xylan/chitin deacetylase (PgdA/CDA1 family)